MARGNYRNYEHAEGVVTSCPSCGSTERAGYFAKQEQEVSGVRDGKPYTHVVWRRTSCTACGQFRIDKTFENRKRAAKA